MDYINLKAAIDAAIKTNSQEEITADVLNGILQQMVTELGEGYTFAGVATPSTSPSVTDGKPFYIATEAGEYTHFGVTVPDSTLAVIYNVNSAWTVATVSIPRGEDGKSTYQLAVEEGFVGTLGEWLASLQGPEGPRSQYESFDHQRAVDDHNTAVEDHTKAGNDASRALDDHNTAAADHALAVGDHTNAVNDHTQAVSDHSTAAADHSQAVTDHTRANNDHTQAYQDATQAASDHSRAESDHSTAASDHSTATSDHSRADSDHATAASDHTASTTATAAATAAAASATSAASSATSAASAANTAAAAAAAAAETVTLVDDGTGGASLKVGDTTVTPKLAKHSELTELDAIKADINGSYNNLTAGKALTISYPNVRTELWSKKLIFDGESYHTIGKADILSLRGNMRVVDGVITHFNATSLVTTGFNQYNNDTGEAYVFAGHEYQVTGSYSSLSIGGQSVEVGINGIFSAESDGYLIVTGGDDTTCVHLALDNSRLGDFESFKQHVLNLPSLVNFGGSLKEAMDAYDEITPTKDIRRVGQVDLGSLTWHYESSRFWATVTDAKGLFFNAVCDGYSNSRASRTSLVNGKFGYWSNASANRIAIYDDGYTDAASFKTHAAGLMLYYELDTPVETVYDEPRDISFIVNEYGSAFLLPDGNMISASIDYKLNLSEQLHDDIYGDDNKVITGQYTFIDSSQGVVISGLNIPIGSKLRCLIESDEDRGYAHVFCNAAWGSGSKYVLGADRHTINRFGTYEGFDVITTQVINDLRVFPLSSNESFGKVVVTLEILNDAKGLANTVVEIGARLTTVESSVAGLNIAQVKSLLGSNGLIMRADTLSDGEAIDTTEHYPERLNKGNCVSFFAKITSFSKIIVGLGYQTYKSEWYEIDDTNIVQKGRPSTDGVDVIKSTKAHGLTISDYICVRISVPKFGKADFALMTKNGQFMYSTDTGFSGNGAPMVISDGSELTECELSCTNIFFKKPLWFYGHSYHGTSDGRIVGQLIHLGLGDWLQNSRSGGNTTQMYDDFVKALQYGCPKYAFFGTIGNESAAAFAVSFPKVIAKCQELGITPIWELNPDRKTTSLAEQRQLILNAGIRYVDLYNFIQISDDEQGNHQWIDGYMDNDGIHMTTLGAKAMAMKIVNDFPEIMQYPSSDSVSDDGGADPNV